MKITDYLDAIRNAWSPQTCAGDFDEWRRARGQCAVTALLVQDWFGGELLRCQFEDGTSHYWNLIPGMGEIDLTREQYTVTIHCPECNGGGFLSEFEPHLSCKHCQGWGTTKKHLPIPRGDIVPRSRLLEGERAIAARTPERYRQLAEAAEALARR